MHCASLGEFEQGRPVMEAFKKQHPEFQTCVTFFSPSGYEIRKNYGGADLVTYLPPDLPGIAKAFLNAMNPTLAVFVKYEVWLNHLHLLHSRQIPHFLISARFDPHQVYFRWYGGAFRKALRQFTKVFVQDPDSAMLVKSFGIEDVIIAPDTRFDRVVAIRDSEDELEDIQEFSANHPTLVAGSTWPPDENLLIEWAKKLDFEDWKIIIAPHEIEDQGIDELLKRLPDSGRYSQGIQQDQRILIIDSIGLLSKLYRYADIAYIGGGFGKAIHNTLEPAAYGIPIVCGPAIKGFREVEALKQLGGLMVGSSQKACIELLDELAEDESKRKKGGQICRTYVDKRVGGTNRILEVLNKLVVSQ